MSRVAVISGIRTPFVKAGGVFGRYTALDLGIHNVEALIRRAEIDPGTVDELVYSTVLLDPRSPNLAREIVLRSSLPKTLSAHFVSNNCISGLVAVNQIAEGIRSGRIKSGIAGGSESMSRPTLTFRRQAESFFIGLAKARSIPQKLALISRFRPNFLMPVPPSPKEPSTGLTMGQHCEITAKEFQIARAGQDEVAFRSHQSAAAALKNGFLRQEIEPLGDVEHDNLIRPDTSMARLAKLPAVFDRSATGTLSAGNSSALTDGASAVWLVSEDEARRLGREILGYVDGVEFSAIAPSDGLLMAPGLALPRLFERHQLTVDSVDYFEIHEAFGAQVLANLEVWEKGWARHPSLKPIGKIPQEKINVNGGSIAIGHPFAATGGRLIVSLLNQLKRASKKRGVLSVCAAGGMGCAMLVERP